MLINRLAVQIWAFGPPELSRSGDSSHKPQRVGRDGQVHEEALSLFDLCRLIDLRDTGVVT